MSPFTNRAQDIPYDTASTSAFNPPLSFDTTQTQEVKEAPRPPAKLKLIIRTFEHKKQIILAAGMMAFIALIMTSAQTWNP